MTPPLAPRNVFTTSRLLEFTTVAELAKQIGFRSEHWSIFAIKELIDNGLDDTEQTGVAPEITVTINPARRKISVADNGSGIPLDVVARLLDFHAKTSSREAYVAPSRCQQGNALQTILAMPFALHGTTGKRSRQAA